ncbi:MAG: amidohydrolase [Solobacterium sp.]|nr:amidohydrolase [Solobacterium sp.]
MAKAYINARIWRSDAEAFLIEDHRFVQIGDNRTILEAVKDGEVIDLKGAFVTPGFIDSHMHLAYYGYYLSTVPLGGCMSAAEIIQALNAKKEEMVPGQVLQGMGYNESAFTSGPKAITRADLDSVSAEIPIVLTRHCGHIACVNTKVLEMCGIDSGTSIEGGEIDYENGLLKENAMRPMLDTLGHANAAEFEEYIVKGMRALNAYGITSCGSDDFLLRSDSYRMPLDVFLRLSYQGRMTIRVNEQCEFRTPEDLASFLDEGYTTGVGNEYFSIGPLKIIADGSLGGRTAKMSEPYADDPTTAGTVDIDEEKMDIMVGLANRYNMPAITHAIGDGAVDQVLRVYRKYLLPGNPLGYGLVHCQIMRSDQTQEAIDSRLNCYIQSLFVDSDAAILKERVKPELAKTSYPWKTLYENTNTSNGSDAPVEIPDALRGIYFAVTRKSLMSGDLMNQAECLTVDQALESYTEKGAKAFGMDDAIGRIAEDYYADFTVMDTDITQCPVEDILKAKIIRTVVGGEDVYCA